MKVYLPDYDEEYITKTCGFSIDEDEGFIDIPNDEVTGLRLMQMCGFQGWLCIQKQTCLGIVNIGINPEHDSSTLKNYTKNDELYVSFMPTPRYVHQNKDGSLTYSYWSKYD